MKKLSPLARQLVETGRRATLPSSADKQRIRKALHRHLAPPAEHPPSKEPTAPPGAPPAAPWPLVSAVTVGVGVLAGAMYLGLSTDADPVVTAPATSASLVLPQPAHTLPPSAPERVVQAPALPQPAASASAGVSRPRPAARRRPVEAGDKTPTNQLAEEVALLSRATGALNTGRTAEALATLAEHQRRFPRGHLAVERRAARAQALCLLGRKAEAQRELRSLSPNSPQAARARRLCEDK